ncbi:MAG TPA: peptidoglycan-binding protein [Nocardioides sp.]|uniref:L,D-transpeptidase family protein n=1 Tax=Nocardioides sp. TaxID=35761 RepID=UPI002F3F7F59
MKVFKTLLTLVLVIGVLGGAAYAGGRLLRDHDQRTVASSGDLPAAPSTSTPSSPTPTPATPSSSPTKQAPVEQDVLKPGAKGIQVRELQQRLFQLAWLPGHTTGVYDAATVAAVKGFQGKRGLHATGVLDRRTWDRLRGMTSTPSHDAMFNVLHAGKPLFQSGDDGDDVRAIQARLRQIAWYFGDVTGTYDEQTVTAVKGFQAKREIPVTGAVDQRTLDRLNAMTAAPTNAEMHNRLPSPGKLDARCLTGRALCIDKTSRTLRWVVDGHVEQTLDARFGSTLNDTPTREGLFHVYLKDADHVSHMYGSSMPFSMFFSGGQAVHYSSDFAAVGYNGASHGCVNIRDYDGIKWLFSQVRVGDKVVVYWS